MVPDLKPGIAWQDPDSKLLTDMAGSDPKPAQQTVFGVDKSICIDGQVRLIRLVRLQTDNVRLHDEQTLNW